MINIWKTNFSEDFFNKIWLKVGERKYIYIPEMKFEKKKKKKVILFKNAGKTICVTLRNNASLFN